MQLYMGDCQEVLKTLSNNSVDLVYLDPPFFSQKEYVSTSEQNYSFNDKWDDIEQYLDFMKNVFIEIHRILKDTGSVFVHCDKYASHYLRCELDKIFGINNFQSEIIWNYKRWSNAKKGLLNNHQNIYFYSKTKNFYFHKIMCDYSPTTNVDQILQLRERNKQGKIVYKTDSNGNPMIPKSKEGVPLSDVWDIPFLNPKAKERTGYPTQKPVLLLERIIDIASKEGDVVLDPFCGSGTTLLAAQRKNRKYIGIDISENAINLTKERLSKNIVSKSKLMTKGKEKYINKTEKELSILSSISAVPVQRNKGIDGFISGLTSKLIPVKIQKNNETIDESIRLLKTATKNKNFDYMILIRTNNVENIKLFDNKRELENIYVVDSADLMIQNLVS